VTTPRSTLRYRRDPEYRRAFIAKVNQRHYSNLAESPTYHALVKARKQIWNFNEAIARYREKIQRLQTRKHYMTRRKEELELKWGQERAARKKIQHATA
jgi:hypothetical protein